MSSTEMEASDSMIFRELSQMSDDQMARVYDMLHDAKQRVVKKETEERKKEETKEANQLIKDISEQWFYYQDDTDYLNDYADHDALDKTRDKLQQLKAPNPVLYERAFDYVRNNGPYQYPPSSLYL